MAYRVSYKLSKQEWEALVRFSREIGVDTNQIAKQSLFMAIQEAYRRAQELLVSEVNPTEGEEQNVPESGNIRRDVEAGEGQGSSSAVLEDTGSSAAD